MAESKTQKIPRLNCIMFLIQDINPSENDQTMRYRKKIEKDESYVNTALKLCSVTILIIFLFNLTDEKTLFIID